MPEISMKILILAVLLGIFLMIWYYSTEIEQLNTQLDSSQEKLLTLELNEKRLNLEIEAKDAQLEDMKNWIRDSRTLNITIKDQVVYLNKTYAIMMFEPEKYPEWLGYTRLDWTIHLRNGMTLKEIYTVCVHEKAHNTVAGRNETAAQEAEKYFDSECFYFSEYLFEKMMEQIGGIHG